MPQETDVTEIEPAIFEHELRTGADVVVVDIRRQDAFAGWHLDPMGQRLVNIPAEDVIGDPEGALARADVPSDAHLRILCTAGNTSRQVVDALGRREGEVLGVHGGMVAWSRVLQWDQVELGGTARVLQFRREARGCLSYLVAAGGEALVVDPAPGIEPYLEAAEVVGARVTHVLDTHVHADHLSGARALARATGAALHLSSQALRRGVVYADEVEAVDDGGSIRVGSADVRIVALPGHTSDMIGVLVDGRALIGGDSLFADSVARPDLELGDDGAADAARMLYRTIHARIDPLDDDVVLLPCHYAGGRIDGPIAPRLAEVRARVGELALDEDGFVRQVLGAMPPRPANYLEIIAVNLGTSATDVEEAAQLEVGGNSCAVSTTWM